MGRHDSGGGGVVWGRLAGFGRFGRIEGSPLNLMNYTSVYGVGDGVGATINYQGCGPHKNKKRISACPSRLEEHCVMRLVGVPHLTPCNVWRFVQSVLFVPLFVCELFLCNMS